MTNIKQLIEKRDMLFIDQTKNIMSHIEFVTEGIKMFLQETEPDHDPGNFSWETVTTVPSENGDILMLIGVVSYDIGTQLATGDGGQMVVVDEENADYFSSILRMGIPFSIVERGDSKSIVEFLTTLDEAATREKKVTVEPASTKEKAVQQTAQPKTGVDFDLDELDDKQLEALRLYNLTNK